MNAKPDDQRKTKDTAAASPHLTLYHYWRSSCSWRVRWALALKGVSYKHSPVDLLHDAHKSPDFMRLNPSGFVPALLIDGQCYGESMALLEYIEETWRHRPLLPNGPLQRLHVRQLCQTIVSGTQPLQNMSTQRRHSQNKDAQTEWARHWIERGLHTYEQLLYANPPGTFSVGGSLSLADICLVPQVYNAQRFGVNLEKVPMIQAIYNNCLKTVECQESAPHNQPGAQLLA